MAIGGLGPKIGVLSLLGFLVIGALVFSNISQALDAQLALAVNHADLGGAATAVMVLASTYGRELFWTLVVGLMLVLGDRDTKLLAIELSALLVAGLVCGDLIKEVAFRARPFGTLSGVVTRVPPPMDSSFPSGHALTVSIGAAFALTKFRRKAVALLLACEAAVVCYSRVYVGAHYPLDVVGGALLAVGIVSVGLFLFDGYFGRGVAKVTSIATRALGEGPLWL
jgi:membrane-associated phospholipid phosphatase